MQRAHARALRAVVALRFVAVGATARSGALRVAAARAFVLVGATSVRVFAVGAGARGSATEGRCAIHASICDLRQATAYSVTRTACGNVPAFTAS